MCALHFTVRVPAVLLSAVGVLLGESLLSLSAIAQLIPDATLGAESSVVAPGVVVRGNPADLIEGGAQRGGNLFHSFEAFNIDTGQAVYFANPLDIQNILTRVTGGAGSNIDGLLGVDGAANLFLLNPNGVIFGPNARLDISGSFTTSTGSSFTFADGSEFRAVPLADELLSVSVPLGVQFNDPQGDITSTGILQTGQDLNLIGRNLFLEGPLIAGGDLALNASFATTIADADAAAAGPTVAQAEGAMTIQGGFYVGIFPLRALGNPSLTSGGPMTIISSAPIQLDSQLESGGDLSFLNLFGGPIGIESFYTPVLVANGNVFFRNYVGPPLKIDAAGSILAGGISIDGIDATLAPDGSGSDADLLASGRTVILQAGVNVPEPVGLPQLTDETAFLLFPFFPRLPGSISVQSIDTTDTTGGNGGAILLSAAGEIFTLQLDSFATAENTDAGNGGMIALDAGADITIGLFNSSSFSRFGNAGSGGDVSLNAGGSISATGNSDSASSFGDSGAGGDISLVAGDGIFSEWLVSSSIARQGNAGNGGNVSLTETDPVPYASFSPFGVVSADVIFSFSLAGLSAGDAGDIEITSGEIGFFTLNAFSGSERANAGNGGSVLLTGEGISGFEISTSAVAVTPGQTSGSGGDITFESDRDAFGFIGRDDFDSDLKLSTFSSTGESGDLVIQGFGDLLIQNVELVASGQITVQFPRDFSGTGIITEPITLEAGEFGPSGNVAIASSERLTLDNVRILSDANGQLAAGNIALQTPGQLQLIDTEINSNTNSVGAAGNISAIAGQGLTLRSGSQILADTTSQGRGGSIILNTPRVDFVAGGQIAASTSGPGAGGNVIFNSPSNSLVIAGDGEISVETSGTGQAGTFVDGYSFANNQNLLAFPDLTIDGALLTASTTGPRAGGDVNIRTSRLTFANGGAIAASTSGPGNGGNLTVTGNSPLTLQGNGRLTVESLGANSGRAGNLNVRASELLRLRDGVELSVTSESVQGGGNINIDVTDGSLVTSGGSFINATSTNPNAGDGGNVTLSLSDGFLIAAPGQNNDIIANAVGGNGGNINISALRLFGFTLQDEPNVSLLRGNNTNDISASSEVGLPGSIALDNLAIDPSQGLTELPLNLEDRTDQITPGCGLGNSDDGSKFVVTGRGGLPPGSGDPLVANGVNVPWVVDDADEGTAIATVEPLDLATPTVLLEAQGVAIDPQGHPYLTAAMVNTAYDNATRQIASVCTAERSPTAL